VEAHVEWAHLQTQRLTWSICAAQQSKALLGQESADPITDAALLRRESECEHGGQDEQDVTIGVTTHQFLNRPFVL